jgi:hypothetical protein
MREVVCIFGICLIIGSAAQANVTDRHVFYNRSAFDGSDPLPNAFDDAAMATDKSALLPGQTATFGNYTSCNRGINGIMVDIAGLTATPTAADFQFHVGNNNDPASWAVAPAPALIARRPGAGTAGADRVTLTWADNLIEKQWLRVSVLATATTGLLTPDVFYFGNAIGESGNSATDAIVSPIDELVVINYINGGGPNPVGVDSAYDYNRDAFVTPQDALIAQTNMSDFLTALRLITVPGSGSPDPAPIPAPPAFVLAAVGLGIVRGFGRRGTR